MRAVSSLPALNWLDISYCDVTAAGVQALRDTTAAPSLTIEWGELEDSEDDLEDYSEDSSEYDSGWEREEYSDEYSDSETDESADSE